MRLGLFLMLVVAVVGAGQATEPPAIPDADELRAVIVENEGDTVEVWIALPANVDAGSVEVQLAGRVVAVRARDVAGRLLRSPPLHLREPVVEDGATAHSAGAWLVVKLRKDLAPPAF
jgi:hypothetical protein